MSSLCEIEHSPLIDSTTATVVCCNCGLVLHEQLTCEDVKYYELPSYLPEKSDNLCNYEVVNGEPVKDLLNKIGDKLNICQSCLLYTSPSPRDGLLSRMPSSA